MRLGPTLVGAGALMSSYRVQVPLLARRCGSCANERLPLRPPEGAALIQSRASLPHALIFNPGISVEYYMGPAAAAAAALFPGRYPNTPSTLQDSLTQFAKAWMRNAEAVRTQLGQTRSGEWAAMRRRHTVSPRRR